MIDVSATETTEERPVPTEFQQKGFTLRQIQREGEMAIYEQSRNGTVMAYEVVIIRSVAAGVIMDRAYPPRQLYPSSEMWGRLGWTCSTLEAAQQRFEQVLARRQQILESLASDDSLDPGVETEEEAEAEAETEEPADA